MKVFFIGICGISMSALADLSKLDDNEVKGSDLNLKNIPECLKGIGVYKQPYLDGVKWADLIVCSSAIKSNEELDLAKKLGKKVISRGEYLGKISKSFNHIIAVAGSHGKTTTTAMIYHILYVSGFNPSLHLGGNFKDVGNVVSAGKDYFVTEACEYCDNFLYLNPDISIITNIEPEHLDYFKTFKNELESFEKFKKQSQIVIEKPKYLAKNIRINANGKISFSLYKGKEKIDRLNLKVGGKYNAQNALYALSCCEILGVDYCKIKLGLETFLGVKKRCESVESSFVFKTFIDYAHHPGEIKESAKYFKKICKGKCIAVFQPHTYSRTKKFFDGFINSLSIFDEVICYKIYPAREKSSEGLSEKNLFDGLKNIGKKSYHITDEEKLRKALKKYNKEDIVVFLGAGDLPDNFDFIRPLA